MALRAGVRNLCRHSARWLNGLALWQRGLAWLLLFSLVFSTGGFLAAWLGFAPVSASAGHWPVTRWFLHFAMRNAVETRAIGTQVPTLNDPAAILKGAGHYATGCAPCHGAPGEVRSLIARQMTPVAPFLPPKVHEWDAGELFWIVKHGVKFTAMPAWPAQQRDDEVWSVVAFLRQLPQLSPEAYEELAYGPRADAGNLEEASPGGLRPLSNPLGSTLAYCARCHGSEGAGRGSGAFPRLANQREEYLAASLKAFAEGKRHSGIMEPVATQLSKATMLALADYYARQNDTVAPPNTPEEPDAIGRGRRIADRGVPERGIPSCSDCHGPGDSPRNPFYPRLAGQYADYLYLQLTLFKSGKRGGTPYAHVMETVAQRLTEEQMRSLAEYYASL